MPDIFIGNDKPKQEKINTAPKKTPIKLNTMSSGKVPHILAAFCQNPAGVTFKNQDQDEVILLFLRAHFITNISWILTVFFLLIAPFIVSLVFHVTDIGSLFSFMSGRMNTIVLFFYYLLVFSYFFINFITWFYNIFLVTQKKIVDIDYSDIVYHNLAITNLNLVQDVNFTQSGFFPSLFDYGDLFLETAAKNKNFEAKSVPQPDVAANIIGDLIGKEGSLT